MATLFKAAHRQPRGDNTSVFEAYCSDNNRNNGQNVALKQTDPQARSTDTLPDMKENAARAAAFLKTLAHEGRLMILCHLGDGEKSVGELENLLELRQAAVSQMLARLREEGLVSTRREGKAIYYSLRDGNTEQVIGLLYKLFCAEDS